MPKILFPTRSLFVRARRLVPGLFPESPFSSSSANMVSFSFSLATASPIAQAFAGGSPRRGELIRSSLMAVSA